MIRIPPPPPPQDEGPGGVEPSTYKLEYRIGDLNYETSQVVEKGGYATPPPEPNLLDGYTFVGWYTDSSFTQPYDFNRPVNGDARLYGLIMMGGGRADCTAVFYIDGVATVKQFTSGSLCPTIDNPQKDGYVFRGWYRTEQTGAPDLREQYLFNSPLYGNITLYACWTQSGSSEVEEKVTLTLRDADGTLLGTTEVNVGGHFTQSPQKYVEERDGYILEWLLNGRGEPLDLNSYVFNTDSTLRIKYIEDTDSDIWHEITFEFWDSSEGGTYTEKVFVKNGDAISGNKLDTISRSKTDYRVTGWYTDEGRTDAWAEDRIVTSDDAKKITLYAEMESIAVPFYKPIVNEEKYVDEGTLMYTYYEHGDLCYLYYLGTVDNTIIHNYATLPHVYRNSTEYSEESIRMDTVMSEESYSQTRSTAITKGKEQTFSTTIPESNGTKHILNVAAGLCDSAASLMYNFSPGWTTVVGGCLSGAGLILKGINDNVPEKPPRTEENSLYEENTETIGNTISKSQSVSQTVSTGKTTTRNFNHLLPGADYNVAHVLLGDVEYYQLVTIDKNDGKVKYSFPTTIIRYDDSPRWVCIGGNESFTDKKPINSTDYPISIMDKTKEQLKTDEADLLQKYIDSFIKPLGENMSGSGTASDPFIITSANQLRLMSFCSASAHFKLGNDIDLSSVNPWKPLPPFSGTLDGDGKAITGLNIIWKGNSEGGKFIGPDNARHFDMGLFQELGEGALVKNLIIERAVMHITDQNTIPKHEVQSQFGLICGYNAATSLISNVTIRNSSIYVDNGWGRIGGIVSYNKGTIENCNVIDCDIQAFGDVGGIVGELHAGEISNCSVVGTKITYIGKAGECHSFGGLVGYSSDGIIRDSTVNTSSFFFEDTGNSSNLAHSFGYLVGCNEGLIDIKSFAENCRDYLGNMKKDNSKTDAGGFVGWGWIVVDVDNDHTLCIDSVKAFKNIVNGDTKRYALLANLDFGSDYTPIESFKGSLEGNNNAITIKKTVSNQISSTYKWGLFSHIDGGVVKNLVIKDSKFEYVNTNNTDHKGVWKYIGFVAGTANNGAAMENISIINSHLTMIHTNTAVGMIVGEMWAGGWTHIGRSNVIGGTLIGGNNNGGILGIGNAGTDVYDCSVNGLNFISHLISRNDDALRGEMYIHSGGVIGLSRGQIHDCNVSNTTMRLEADMTSRDIPGSVPLNHWFDHGECAYMGWVIGKHESGDHWALTENNNSRPMDIHDSRWTGEPYNGPFGAVQWKLLHGTWDIKANWFKRGVIGNP